MTGLRPVPDQDCAEESTLERIRRAEAAIAGLRSNFIAWAKADLDLIDGHFSAAAAATDVVARNGELEVLRRIAHNIKGQGGTFGCHAFSEAAAHLDAILKQRGDHDVLLDVSGAIEKLKSAYARELA